MSRKVTELLRKGEELRRIGLGQTEPDIASVEAAHEPDLATDDYANFGAGRSSADAPMSIGPEDTEDLAQTQDPRRGYNWPGPMRLEESRLKRIIKKELVDILSLSKK